jgi:hypothetical protein
MLIALFLALFAFTALGISNARPVHASYSSSWLYFACYYHVGSHILPGVTVQGYNQNNVFTNHYFYNYITNDTNGNYWWYKWAQWVTFTLPDEINGGWITDSYWMQNYNNGGRQTVVTYAC